MRFATPLALVCLLAPLVAQEQEPASPAPVPRSPEADEAKYVDIVDVPAPDDAILEVGGIVERGDELFVTTRRGEIWRATGVRTGDLHWAKWAEGLQEPLGVLDHDGWLYVGQRGELSRVRDRDGDGRMDELQTVASGWPLSGNYHEYCFGPVRLGDGSFVLTLNKPFGDEPFGRADWRGWAVRIPAAGGEFVPFAAGLRSPAGVGVSPAGELFYTDNQGEWCAACKFAVLEEGDFHGHPWGIESCKLPQSRVEFPGEVKSGLRMAEAAATIPHFKLPAVWIPYDLLGRSAAGFVWDTAGNFGPFRGQVFCGDQYSSEVFRISLDQVDGHWQGACYPFRAGLKCGVLRLCWSFDGSLWCGLTNRGWGSLGQAEYGLQRLKWKGVLPFAIETVTATPKGFRVRFTSPVSTTAAAMPGYEVKSWTYDHHETYGCPPRDEHAHAITGIAVAADARSVDLEVDGLETVRVYELRCAHVLSAGGETPWHPVAWYTLNRRPR
ncbi:MAG: hypothetical protein U1E73_10680 [Planctomycetota bacterium]